MSKKVYLVYTKERSWEGEELLHIYKDAESANIKVEALRRDKPKLNFYIVDWYVE